MNLILVGACLWAVANCGIQAPAAPPDLTPQQQERLQRRDEYADQTAQLRAEQKWAEAIDAAKKMLAIEREVLGDDHDDVAGSLEQLVEMYAELGQFAAAATACEEIVAIRDRVVGTAPWQRKEARPALAQMHRFRTMSAAARQELAALPPLREEFAQRFEQGQMREAAEVSRRMLSIQRRLFGEVHPDYATTLSELGAALFRQKEFEKAKLAYEQSRRIRRQVLGDDHPQCHATLVDLIVVYEILRQPERIQADLRELIAAADKQATENYAAAADDLSALATSLAQNHRPAESLVILLGAQQILESRAPADSRVGALLSQIGAAHDALRNLPEAENAYQRALRFVEEQRGPNHLDVAVILHELGGFYHSTGQTQRATPLVRRAVQIREAHLPPDHLQLAESLNHLAVVLSATRESKESIALLERVLKIREAGLPENHPDLAQSLGNLAMAYANQRTEGDRTRAITLQRRALKIEEDNYGPEHLRVASQARNLASLLDEDLAQRADAEPLFRRALGIVESAVGNEDPQVADYLAPLADVCRREGQLAEAAALNERCLKLRASRLPPWHPDIVSRLTSLSQIYVAEKSWDQAIEAFDRLHRSQRLHLGFNLPAMSPPQQLAYLQQTHESCFHASLSLLSLLPRDENLMVRSAEWVLNGKSIAHQVRTEEILLARDSGDPQAPQIARQLLEVRAQLAALTAQQFATGFQTPADPQLTLELERQQTDLAARLDVGVGRLKRVDPWIDLAKVRQRIPEDAVLVELVDFDLWDFETGGWRAVPRDEQRRQRLPEMARSLSRLGAWIIPPAARGAVRFVDLGDSDELRKSVAEYQRQMQSALRQIQIDEADAESDIRRPLQAIADQALAPLEQHLGGFKRWLISPDEMLWNVPFAALPLRDGSYALEKHSISYLVSGRDLLANPAAISSPAKPGKANRGAALIIGDPDFDLNATKTNRIVQQLIPQDRLRVRGSSSADTERVGRDWNRLPGTEDEIQGILAPVAAFTRVEPEVRTESQALESFVKAADRPQVLVLATHGFLLRASAPLPPPSEVMISLRKFRYTIGDLAPVEFVGDPLVRCGLVFAGANQRDKENSPTADDGVLTGLEVLGCDLRGTKLVVLSACETGLGDVNAGEGVSGLRQAFQLAGAESVVASLWKVSDYESVSLMTKFWENLAAGQGRADALRNAQLAFVKEHRAKEQAAHPFFWAAFTLTGNWE